MAAQKAMQTNLQEPQLFETGEGMIPDYGQVIIVQRSEHVNNRAHAGNYQSV
jgi:hypothetical protein